MFFSTEFLFKTKLLITQHDFDTQSKPGKLKMFL